MNVVVIGAGKMGLPLACVLADHGAKVVACDVRPSVVEAINRGDSPIDEPGIPEAVKRLVNKGSLSASSDTAASVARAEVVIVIVPRPPDGVEADTSLIESASREIAKGLKRNTMVCYETTLPIGGTRRLGSILETSGLEMGTDLDLVFSPERVKSQLVLQRLTETPKVVGGITPGAATRAAAFYHQFLGAPTINVGTLEAAELVKLAGMIYRDVNIALANELARYSESVGVDLRPVVEAANTDGETQMLKPGIGVGGHCTPVYPYFLIQHARRIGQPSEVVELSRRINEAQPTHTLDRLEDLWSPVRGKTVMVLGLGFRPQVKEHICSPAFALRDVLLRRGANVLLHDPLYTDDEIRAHGFTPGSLNEPKIAAALILNTAHAIYAKLDFNNLAARGVKAIVDGRSLWKPEAVRAAGLVYVGIGYA